MQTSTIERPGARHNTTVRQSTDDVIRTHPGKELPAAGSWIVGRGQRVTLVRRGLRRRSIEATVLAGTFNVAPDSAKSSLELMLTLDGPELVRVSSCSALSIEVNYRGVFRQRGRPPSMWLTVRAALGHCALPQLPGRGAITVDADLNLNPAPVDAD